MTEIDKALTPEPKSKLLVAGIGEGKGAVPTSLADAVATVKKSNIQKDPEISTNNIINELKSKETTKEDESLTADKLAAEQFFASLANPVLENMPVDTNLIAALNGMGGMDSAFSPDDPGHLLQVSRSDDSCT